MNVTYQKKLIGVLINKWIPFMENQFSALVYEGEDIYADK